jgi:hypothetical protein
MRDAEHGHETRLDDGHRWAGEAVAVGDTARPTRSKRGLARAVFARERTVAHDYG